MTRLRLAVIALTMLAAPPASAQPDETARLESELTEGAAWAERLGEALVAGSDGFQSLNKDFQGLVATPLTRERAAAAAPGLRAGIERSRADVRRSEAMLDSLPALRPEIASEMSAEQLVADARAHNGRMMALLDSFDAFIVAMGKADMPAMERALPRMLEGSFILLTQQRLLIRNRMAGVPRDESSYQALGVAAQIYRAMEGVFRHSIIARTGSAAEAEKAAAAVGAELRLVAEDTRALAAAGRRNLKRELAEIDAARRGKDVAEARMAERVRPMMAAEEKTFELADRLVAYAQANSAITPAQLRSTGEGSAGAPLRQMERDYVAITQEQAALLAGGE
jgi:hypothetical protein